MQGANTTELCERAFMLPINATHQPRQRCYRRCKLVRVVMRREHGATLDKRTGGPLDFQCSATLKGLVGQLKKVQEYFGGLQFKLCYEASYVGFSLQRDLRGRGFECEVMAPSSIARRAGKAVKTDRIDAKERVEIYASDLLTTVAPPDAQTEQDRVRFRSKPQLVRRQGKIHRHIQSLVRFDYDPHLNRHLSVKMVLDALFYRLRTEKGVAG